MNRPFPDIAHISKPAARAFSFMVDHVGQWFTAEQLAEATGASVPTIYRRFGNLVSASALQARRMNGFREFCLHPDWRASALGRRVYQRAAEPGPSPHRVPQLDFSGCQTSFPPSSGPPDLSGPGV